MAMPLRKGTILLTGANGGLGRAIVSQMASKPDLTTYHGILTVRHAESSPDLDAVLDKDASTLDHSFEKLSLDLSSLASVREAAADINARVKAGSIPRISAIMLNAGYEESGNQVWTSDGLDTTFVVNFLSQWLLVLLLLQSMDQEKGRIVWISSWAHNPYDKHNVQNGSFKEQRYKTIISDDLEPLAKGAWSASVDDKTGWAAGYRRYGASKLCAVTMLHELQRRLDRDPALSNISVLAVDPGAMSTGIVRHSAWIVRVLIFQLMLGAIAGPWVRLFPNGTWRTTTKSARDVLAAALDCGPPPLTSEPKGVYLNGSELGEYSAEAKDAKTGRIVWEGSVRFSNLEEDETVLQNWK
ncbi:hypothetical protein CP532_1779 [Ophiocordyceps camponoti-leonardi (nom. inval.)]|nr:hypothetical protein CP532_1779 [Ophiocordyceps camponoti-leonardi (nom. inval.)]